MGGVVIPIVVAVLMAVGCSGSDDVEDVLPDRVRPDPVESKTGVIINGG
jgi:hypothetical protein